MTTCPRCDRAITPTAVNCPHCQLVLKAHGHPGMTLHRATGETSLCETCAYEADDSCNFPQRPNAKTCTLYQDINQDVITLSKPSAREIYPLPWWRKISRFWAGMIVLILISLVLSIL
ncbi:MAG: zinc ribbon domain-containing protein [Phormidesmis sp.]